MKKGRIKKIILIVIGVIIVFALFDMMITRIQAGKIPHRFAGAKEGARIMLANTDYYNNLSQNDIEFRLQKTGGTLDEFLAESEKSVKSFNIFEKHYINKCFAKMQKTLKKNGYILPGIDEIVLIKADMTIESGNSGYTHGTEIYLDGSIVTLYTFLHAISGDYFETLLWHELFHCLTRCNADFRAEMYSLINFSVADSDYEFPPCVKEKYLSNPDVEHHNSYATFVIDGEEIDCYPVWTVKMNYSEAHTNFSKCNEVVLVPVDGTDTYYTIDQASNFYDVFGMNTDYWNDPEECMADNFKYAMLYGIEGKNGNGYPNPEIVQGVIELMRSGKFN